MQCVPTIPRSRIVRKIYFAMLPVLFLQPETGPLPVNVLGVDDNVHPRQLDGILPQQVSTEDAMKAHSSQACLCEVVGSVHCNAAQMVLGQVLVIKLNMMVSKCILLSRSSWYQKCLTTHTHCGNAWLSAVSQHCAASLVIYVAISLSTSKSLPDTVICFDCVWYLAGAGSGRAGDAATSWC